MALQVWLPLTKDLRNQGLSDVTVTNNGATFNSAGKLGGCYNFTTSSYQKIGFPYSLANYTEFTVCVWVKPVSTTITGCLFTFINPNDYWQFVITNGNSVGIRDNSSGETGSRKDYTLGSFVANVWTHLAISYNKGIVKIYKDGVLFSTNNTGGSAMNNYSGTNAAIGESVTSSSSYYFAGSVNDFRIYDHCLSPMEVKELAKGLVLHYPLNRNGWGQENLIKEANALNLDRPFTNSDYSSREAYVSCPTNTNTIVCSQTGAFNCYRWFNGYANLLSITTEQLLTPGQPWVFSLDIKSDDAEGTFILWMNIRVNNYDVASPNPEGNATSSVNLSNKWKRYWISITPREEDSARINLLMGLSGTITKAGSIQFKNLKFENGKKMTPWCPSNTEILATTMGLNSTIEYDCSGFCNNGTRIGTFDWTSDTPKYQVSQVFNGTDNAIQTPNLTTMVTDKNYTIACWTYKTVIGTKNYQTIYGGPSGFELEARSSSSTSPLYRIHNWGGGTTAYNFGEWTHFCFVHTDSDSKLYVNGELKITGTSVNIPSGNYFVGAWNTSTSQNYEGNMSDFRIYATALSADDVKSLYQNCATIDADGTIHGQIRS